jgi:hypothetical protein
MPVDLFEPLFDEGELDANFRHIINNDYYESAKGIINEIFNSWGGIDHHFVSEFQTSGFSARLWELYLYITFKSLKYDIEKCPEGRPDFLLKKNGIKVYVEAVTSNPSLEDEKFIQTTFAKEDTDTFFLKLRTTLLKKIKKKYWELDWVNGHPLVFAVSPFHSSQALNVTDFEVRKYLYGVVIDKRIINKKIEITETKSNTNFVRDKRLSNFFDIPLTSNISGILYSNSGTIGKFTRMGYQAGYGDPILSFFYSGSCHDDNINSLGIQQFMFQLKRANKIDFVDQWKYGLSLFHNDKAIYSLGYDFFDQITQVKYTEKDGLLTKHIEFHPYNAKNLRNVILK